MAKFLEILYKDQDATVFTDRSFVQVVAFPDVPTIQELQAFASFVPTHPPYGVGCSLNQHIEANGDLTITAVDLLRHTLDLTHNPPHPDMEPVIHLYNDGSALWALTLRRHYPMGDFVPVVGSVQHYSGLTTSGPAETFL